jgi:hypothetical protein
MAWAKVGPSGPIGAFRAMARTDHDSNHYLPGMPIMRGHEPA